MTASSAAPSKVTSTQSFRPPVSVTSSGVRGGVHHSVSPSPLRGRERRKCCQSSPNGAPCALCGPSCVLILTFAVRQMYAQQKLIGHMGHRTDTGGQPVTVGVRPSHRPHGLGTTRPPVSPLLE